MQALRPDRIRAIQSVSPLYIPSCVEIPHHEECLLVCGLVFVKEAFAVVVILQGIGAARAAEVVENPGTDAYDVGDAPHGFDLFFVERTLVVLGEVFIDTALVG